MTAQDRIQQNQYVIVTKNFPENQHGGIMLCGINFGIGKNDREPNADPANISTESSSFFSDRSVTNYTYRNRILDWFALWGIRLNDISGNEGPFERSFFQTNWLATQTRSIDSDGTIDSDVLVTNGNADGFLAMVTDRKPSVIFFFGSFLIEALNDIRIRARVEELLGSRPGNAQTFQANIPDYKGTRFNLRVQQWPRATVICLPHPTGTIGLSGEYVGAFKSQLQAALPAQWFGKEI